MLPGMKKINEIFYSLQGEGFHTGTPAVFVRFSGCNLSCAFCDTDHKNGTLLSNEAIIEQISRFPARIVILTGGEPSLFIDKEFIDQLHEAGFRVHIETNGTHTIPGNIDWITCSPKIDCQEEKNVPLLLQEADELKVVYRKQNLDILSNFRCKVRFLQPCSGKNIPETVSYILSHPEWRLSLQTHKILDII